jgi:threonine dehydrogenase-like Zn-dependent dehydrogenase
VVAARRLRNRRARESRRNRVAARPNGGSVVVVGLATEPMSITPLRFVRRGLSLLSSLIYDHPHDFRCAIDLISSGALHPAQHVRLCDGSRARFRRVLE